MKNSNKATAILPFNPETFSDENFQPSAVTDKPNVSKDDNESDVEESSRTDEELQSVESSENNKESQPVSSSSYLTLPVYSFGHKVKRKGEKSEIMTSSHFKIKLMESFKERECANR